MENINSISNSNSNSNIDLEKEFKKLIDEFEEPGDVDDIQYDTQNKEQLDIIKDQLFHMSTDQLNELLTNLSKENKINPNKNWFTLVTKENIVKFRLKNLIKNQKLEKKEKN